MTGFDWSNPLDVTLNGKPLAKGLTFPNNQNEKLGLNQRYFLGWKSVPVDIPAGLLKKGANTLSITNTRDVFESDRWCYAVVDDVTFEFAEPVEMRIDRVAWPDYYYGLSEGVEPFLWPAVNYDDRLCLVVGAAVEVNFFVTLPKDKPLGKLGSLAKEPTRHPKREILVHFQTDAPIEAATLTGEPIKPTNKGGQQEYVAPIDRLINYETPHAVQGVRLFLTAKAPFEGKAMKVWWTVDGVAYRVKTYPLRAVALTPPEGREKIDFLLSLWGGGTPEGPGDARPVRQTAEVGGLQPPVHGHLPGPQPHAEGGGLRRLSAVRLVSGTSSRSPTRIASSRPSTPRASR